MNLRFKYTNHRGEEHEYTIEPHRLGINDKRWTITGICIERDGKTRWSDAASFPIRSFAVTEMREIQEV